MTIFNWINEILVSKKHWNDFTEDEQLRIFQEEKHQH